MKEHELKTWPIPFEGVWDGSKLHEIRVDDREFRVGDVLRLREWDPILICASCPHEPHPNDTCKRRSGGTAWACACVCSTTRARGYTGRELTVRVTYKTRGGQWGLPADLCVMSIERIEAQERAA